MDYTIVGKIINTHGIKGEVKVYPLTDDIERFSDLEKVYIGDSKKKFHIDRVRYHKGFPIIGFREIQDINEVLPYRDEYIYVDQEDRIVLPEDHYFIHDLIDCSVYDMDNNLIGILKDVIQYTANDVYVVKDEANRKEYLIPAVKEFVKEVDIENKRIYIDPIEGMIE
ncbi:MAG: ribosome maturation factor RimM [Tissierellia bacterium]|nr:ribosome maturation factor RimM [Tissierellia bacterium]